MTPRFKKIRVIDVTSLKPEDVKRLADFSSTRPTIHRALPKSSKQLVEWIGDSDCVIVSLKVSLPRETLVQIPKLKYIGVYGTSTRRIDLVAAKELSTTVTNIKEYCDKETAEFVLTEMLKLARGLGPRQWRKEPVSLSGKTVGIVGLGAVGKELATMCHALGMTVLYSSNHRNQKFEDEGIEYRSLRDLLAHSDIVSLHVPPDTMVLRKEEFKLLREGSILINTSLGPVCETKPLRNWISSARNFLILDAVIGAAYPPWRKQKNVLISPKVAAITRESMERRVQKLFKNMEVFLAG